MSQSSLRRNLRILAVTGLLAVPTIALLRAAPAPSPQTSSTSTQYVTYDANHSVWLNAPHTVAMSQGVAFQQGDAVLKTDAALVNLDSQLRALNAKSEGPVHLYDPQNDLRGDHGFIDFTRHLATLTDHVTLIVKPSAQDKGSTSVRGQFKEPATVTCAQMTYDYRRKVGRIPGSLTVHQSNRVLTADSGEYDTKSQTVTLSGHVHGKDTDGNIIEASRVVAGVQAGAESITIPVPTHGRFQVRDETTDTASAAPPAPAQPPPPSAAGKKP